MASFLNSVRGSVTNAVGSVGKAVGVTGPAPGAPKVDTAEREARLQASAAAADESPFAQGMQEAKKYYAIGLDAYEKNVAPKVEMATEKVKSELGAEATQLSDEGLFALEGGVKGMYATTMGTAKATTPRFVGETLVGDIPHLGLLTKVGVAEEMIPKPTDGKSAFVFWNMGTLLYFMREQGLQPGPWRHACAGDPRRCLVLSKHDPRWRGPVPLIIYPPACLPSPWCASLPPSSSSSQRACLSATWTCRSSRWATSSATPARTSSATSPCTASSSPWTSPCAP